MFGTKLKVAAGVLAGALASGGLAFASIPAADGTITACYTKYAGLFDPKGSLRVVDSPSQCRSNETALAWNEEGPVGPSGPPGADGADGIDGLDGTNGVDGLDGTNGTNGLDGTNGVDGLDGLDGLDGQPGPPGPPGPAGISGARFVTMSSALDLPDSGDMVKVAGTTLPAGSYLATANVQIVGAEDDENAAVCDLRHGAGFIGGQATGIPSGYDDRYQIALDIGTLTVTGGANVAEGEEISLWCRAEGHDTLLLVRGGTMVIFRVGGFF